MANIFAKAAQTTAISRGSEGNRITQVRATRDGAAITMDWLQALVAEGRVHGVNTGTASDPDTFNDAYAAAEQDLYIFVPAGTLIVPIYMGIEFEDTAGANVLDVVASYSSNGDSAVTGDALTVYNYRTLASPASSVTATAVVTGTGTTGLGGTDFLEFWRPYAGFGEDAFNSSTAPTMGGQFGPNGASWSAKRFVPPFIGDADTACALNIWSSGAAAAKGFLTAIWVELPASAFS